MAEKEYFLILPLLLYGLAISDLVNSWRSFFIKERRYMPYVLTSLVLLELSFWNFYRMHHWMTEDTFSTYFSYFKVLLPPLVFLLVVAVFTPDHDVSDIRGYFTRNMTIIFTAMAVFTALHFIFEPNTHVVPRLVGIVILLVTAVLRKPWMVYVLVAFRVLTWFMID